jgi:hypothetical protein
MLSGGSTKPPKNAVPTVMSAEVPSSRSLSLLLKPDMTLLTTISVATPSMMLTMQTKAR